MGGRNSRHIIVSSGNDYTVLTANLDGLYLPSKRLVLGNKMRIEVTTVRKSGMPCVSSEGSVVTNFDIDVKHNQSEYHLDRPYANVYISREAGSGELVFNSYVLLERN